MTHTGTSNQVSFSEASASHNFVESLSGDAAMQLLDGIHEGIVVLDRDLRCSLCNAAFERLTGVARERILGRPAAEALPMLADGAWSTPVRDALRGHAGTGGPLCLADAGGVVRRIEAAFTPLRAADGAVAGVVAGVIVHLRDVTERIEQQQKIARLTRISAVLGSINAAIVDLRDRQALAQEACRIAVTHGAFLSAWIGLLDEDTGKGRIVAVSGGTGDYVNHVYLTVDPDAPTAGRPANVAMRMRRPVICNDVATDPSFAPIRDELLAKRHLSVTAFPLVAGDRLLGVLSLFADSAGFFDDAEMTLLNQLASDISFGLEAILKDEQLNYLAYHDPVTGLPNRSFFTEQLSKKLSAANPATDRLILSVGDIRRLGGINESFGRGTGDAVLREFARRLTPRVRNPESLSYLGNGRFASTVGESIAPTDIAHGIEQFLHEAAGEPFVVDGERVFTSTVIGVALYPDDGTTAETLLRNAEAAVTQAKLANVPYLFYEASLNSQVADTLRLENRLRQALERNEFVLHYQPKVCSTDGTIVGLEALLRWNDPERGLVYPDQFISALENSGLVVDAGRWAIERALADFRAWRDAGLALPRIAVNVSVKQLQHESFLADLRELDARDGGIGAALELEITESMVMDNIDRQIATLGAIKAMGIRVAVDDFGTGYSSLSYLAKLPIDTLKVDRSFIFSMTTDPASMTIVSSIVSLAHSLGLSVVAEGVETEEHAACLRRMGCDEMQGYLFSRPLPLQDVVRQIGRRNR